MAKLADHLRRKRTLTTEAREAATYRGHTLGRFAYTTETDSHWTHRLGVPAIGRTVTRITGIATCPRCGREVQIDTCPPPNGIDIAGEAVALGCLTTTTTKEVL